MTRIVLETTDRDLAERVDLALTTAGISTATVEDVTEGGLERWCVEVDESEADRAAQSVVEVDAQLMEERSSFRCGTCGRGMIVQDNGEANAGFLDFTCRRCKVTIPISLS